MRLLWLMLLPAVLTLVLTAGFVVLTDYQGQRWPGKYIVIKDESGHSKELGQAVAQINATGIGIRILVSDKDPDVVIKQVDQKQVREVCDSNKCVGHASFIGYRGRQEEILLSRQFMHNNYNSDNLIIHELGHVLGLRHSQEACRLMNRNDILAHCDQAEGWQRCGFQRAEIVDLAKLYGRGGSYDPWCPYFAIQKGKAPTTIMANNQEVDNWQPRPRDPVEVAAKVKKESPALSRSFSRR